MFGSYLGVSDCFRRIRTSSSSTAAIFLKPPYYFIDEDVGETLFKGFLRAIMGLRMRLKNVLFALSGLLAVVGFLMLLVPLTDVLSGDELSYSFLILGVVLVIVGYASFKKTESLSVIESLLVASLAWLVIPALSALALVIETRIDFADAFFESMSGFTGTGFTVLTPSTLKKSILIWRALMQWTGELGIVVFAMIVIPYFYETARTVYGLERPLRIGMNLYETAKRLILVYITLTLIGFVSYVVTGLTPFDALTHIMTTIATGGMSTYNEGYNIIYAYSPSSAIPFMVFMTLGALNFIVLYNLITGNFREVLRSEELRYFYSRVDYPLSDYWSYLPRSRERGLHDRVLQPGIGNEHHGIQYRLVKEFKEFY
jgi:trk system potassium uptake protein TrkH